MVSDKGERAADLVLLITRVIVCGGNDESNVNRLGGVPLRELPGRLTSSSASNSTRIARYTSDVLVSLLLGCSICGPAVEGHKDFGGEPPRLNPDQSCVCVKELVTPGGREDSGTHCSESSSSSPFKLIHRHELPCWLAAQTVSAHELGKYVGKF